MTVLPFKVRKGLEVANSTVIAVLTPLELNLDTQTIVNTTIIDTTTINAVSEFRSGALFTANSTLVNAQSGSVSGKVNTEAFFATSNVTVGSNVYLNTLQLKIGNSTVNTTANSTDVRVTASNNVIINTGRIRVIDNLNTANLTANGSFGIRVQNTTYNANLSLSSPKVTIGVAGGFAYINTGSIGVGPNVTLTTDSVTIGNSTVNAFTNSSHIIVDGYANTSNLTWKDTYSIHGVVLANGGFTSISTFEIDLSPFTAYPHIKLFIYSANVTANGTWLRLELSEDGGNSYLTDYGWVVHGTSTNATPSSDTFQTGDFTDTYIYIYSNGNGIGNGSSNVYSFDMDLYEWSTSGSHYKSIEWMGYRSTSSTNQITSQWGHGSSKSTSPYNRMRFTVSSGNTTGRYVLYGYE